VNQPEPNIRDLAVAAWMIVNTKEIQKEFIVQRMPHGVVIVGRINVGMVLDVRIYNNL